MSIRLLKWGSALIVLTVLGFFIWRQTHAEPIRVSAKPVIRGTVERTVANTRAGTVKACRRARLSLSVGGQIAKLPVKTGDRVKAGELLLELWNVDLSAQVAMVEHEIASAQSRAQSICLKADLSRRNADRSTKLRQSNAIAEEKADAAAAEARALRAECAAAWAEVTAREKRLVVTQANLDRTRLVAPFDGVIAEINGELFEYVTPSPVGIPTPPAVDIIDNTCFYISAPIDEVDAAEIRPGMPARISMDAFAQRRFNGHVSRIASYVLDIEKQARTVDVEVGFDDPADIQTLLAGYSADIEVILNVRQDVISVPTDAIIENQKVYVFSPEEGIVTLRPIRTGLSNWDRTEIVSGLTIGEYVVVNVDHPDLKDGVSAILLKEGP